MKALVPHVPREAVHGVGLKRRNGIADEHLQIYMYHEFTGVGYRRLLSSSLVLVRTPTRRV